MPVFTADAFWTLAQRELQTSLSLRAFKAHFGCPPEVIAEVWARIDCPDGALPVHCLWMFAFIKSYETEETAASRFCTTPKTWRGWVWTMLVVVQQLKPTLVSF